MKVVGTIQEVRNEVKNWQRKGLTVGFVPTMGALHNGHLSLFRIARKKADILVVSIYVNPEQFGPNEDFSSYPRTMETDLGFCKEEQVDLVFTPSDEIMYGSGKKFFRIELDELNDHMDGASRPGYFQGISLVVNKLFNIVQPDLAVFGQKDYQQYRIIEQMVKEFNHDIQLEMAPVERAEDGLALSSRNAYLSSDERAVAPALQESMKRIVKGIQAGDNEPSVLLKEEQKQLEAKGFKNDYLSVYALDDLKPVTTLRKGDRYVLAGAAYLGKTRLIDNIIFDC